MTGFPFRSIPERLLALFLIAIFFLGGDGTPARPKRACLARVAPKEPAGRMQTRLEALVTGDPTPKDVLLSVAMLATRSALILNPGAEVHLRGQVESVDSLPKGRLTTVRIPLAIEGKGYQPVEGTIEVWIKNVDVEFAEATLLMISNRPEELNRNGIVFEDLIPPDEPARLLYYHKNVARGPRDLWVSLKNLENKNLRVLLRSATSGPDSSPIKVGHRATQRYLEWISSKSGYIVTIPPASTLNIVSHVIPPNFTVSGLLFVQALDKGNLKGGSLKVSVNTTERNSAEAKILEPVVEPFNPFRIHPHGTFYSPNIKLETEYVVGNGEGAIEFATPPWLIDQSTGHPNTGSYGVLYRISLKLTNRSCEARKVTLYFVPLNGTSMGSFLLEGRILEVGVTRRGEERVIQTLEVPPQVTRDVSLVTLPEAGSCYPAKILIKTESGNVVTK